MKILLIATYFSPDTAIAAVRPYMFAKYLNELGHDVTVVRSGIINNVADDSLPRLKNVRVISYMGENSAAERYERGERLVSSNPKTKVKFAYLPAKMRAMISSVYHWILRPVTYIRARNRCKNRFILLKATLHALVGEHFDIVFSTYSELENAYAGEYAARLFKCKWIMDFRCNAA